MKRALAGLRLLALICCAAFSQSTEAPTKFELADVHFASKTGGQQFFSGGVLQIISVTGNICERENN